MSESGDTRNDIRVNTKINFYGPVVVIGSIPILGVGLAFLLIWITTHWSAAIALSGWLVYGFFALLGATLFILVMALAVKIVIHPLVGAYERHVLTQGQELKNKVIWAQENCVIYYSEVEGSLVPLFPEQQSLMIEAPKTASQEDAKINEALVLELYDQKGATYENVAKALSTSYHQIQKVCSAAVRNGHTWKNR